ncbi:MAG: peptide-methionine (S)-S-oxide reductase MsrA [Nannocystaceae bacterium]|nr:peptide-methionine (S)-S-oxide reductase MsrA [Nannocystaceae bacterium]
MTRLLRPRVALAALCCSLLTACSPAPTPAGATTPGSREAAPVADERVAYFAGGCFWGVEHFLEQIDGVIAVESGYMGGHVESPSYADVSSQTSGHLETVRVRYDGARVGYEALAKRFFEIHDPTQADGQGPDIGPEYLSAVFYNDEGERTIAAALIERLRARGYDVATELRPAEHFWPAEAYHQDYYVRSGRTPYCHAPVKRFGD